MSETIEYQWETPESIAAHEHEREFLGKHPEWYRMFPGGNCPVCGATPVFETQTVKKEKSSGMKVYGLSSGERVNK